MATDRYDEGALDAAMDAAIKRVKTSRRMLKKAKRSAQRAIEFFPDWCCTRCGYESMLDPAITSANLECPSCKRVFANPHAAKEPA